MIIRDHRDRAPSGGKLLGTCAGLEDRTVPPMAWRIGRMIAMQWLSSKRTIVAFWVAAPTPQPVPR